MTHVLIGAIFGAFTGLAILAWSLRRDFRRGEQPLAFELVMVGAVLVGVGGLVGAVLVGGVFDATVFLANQGHP